MAVKIGKRKYKQWTMPERLRWFRENCKMSQHEVAAEFGFHRETITEIEAGRRTVSAEEAVKFSELYGVGLKYLITGDPNDI